MFFYEGYTCPVCGKPFQASADIVVCPTCGAPHHRSCWQREGHCHFEADHGTDRQWSREKNPPKADTTDASTPPSGDTRRCPYCGFENPSFAEFCSHCGRPTGAEDWHSATGNPTPPFGGPTGPAGAPFGYGEYRPFQAMGDPYGGVSPDEEIEEVPASQLAAFVGPNTAYYLPRFRKISQDGSKCSWNWGAFLLTPYWLLYRKNYLFGGLMLVLEILRTFLESFLLFRITNGGNVALNSIVQSIASGGTIPLFVWVLVLSSLLDLLLRVLFGLSANWLYLRTAVSRIKKLQKDDETPDTQAIATSGGVSFALGIVAYSLLLLASMMAQYIFYL